MSKQDNLAISNKQPVIEDLAATEGQAEEVKGGLNYHKIHIDYIEQKPDRSL